MKIEHISGSLFSIDLTPPELIHLLAFNTHTDKHISSTLKLICEIGFTLSRLIEEQADNLCEQKKSLNINSS